MRSSIAIFSALAVAGFAGGFAESASAQIPVYQTTVTYTTSRPVKIKDARVVPPPPAFATAPTVVVQQPVYYAPPPAPVYYAPPPAPVYVAPPPVCYVPPVVNIGFGFGGCRPRVGFGIGFGFGGFYGPRGYW